jgi:hypothetical protein
MAVRSPVMHTCNCRGAQANALNAQLAGGKGWIGKEYVETGTRLLVGMLAG